MSVELNKPYMYADVEMKHEKQSSKLLLDLGNTDSVWLFPFDKGFYLQPS
jgi:hypothetical protein